MSSFLSTARCILILSLGLAHAETRPASTNDTNTTLNKGAQIATAVSTVTSTSISPLFGICVLGVYEYVRAPRNGRAALPFYSKPVFWIPVCILLLLVLLKDTIGGTAPVLKKPLDALGVLVVTKASFILIAFPVMLSEITRLTGVRITDPFTAIEPVAYAASGSTSQ